MGARSAQHTHVRRRAHNGAVAWTDAELVHRLQLIEQYGSTAAAARAVGVSDSTLRNSVREARARGLTARSRVVDVEHVLRTKLRVAEAELAAIRRENLTAEEIRKHIYGLAEMTPDPPRWIGQKRPSRAPGVPMTIWSDWHWGEVVRASEVGGVNSFNRAVARQRVKRLVDVTIDLAVRHMVRPQYPGIVVCLGGDMISGTIHEELRETNDGHVQQSLLEVQEQLAMALTAMADTFGRVFVPCVVGNHGRMSMKPRAKGRVYESFEWNLYCQLERYFRSDKRLQFMIPSESDAYFSVLGHRFLLTHGDALGVKGGDGIIGAIGPITRGAMKVGRSEAQIGRDFDTLLMGHWHLYIPRGDAGNVIVNGSLKGYDEYARLFLRVPYSRPSQALWFVHQDHGITAQWQVYLEDAKRPARPAWVSWQSRAHEMRLAA
ncbi:MAG TPA: hypothetical protein VNK52_16105 [Hyphomicrobiaceae bacterium]|nr:hypothetical protein [Hyphomicrobiaceae bacterium]